MEKQLSAQSSFQKLNVDNSCRKHIKLDITFLRSNFTVFFTFCQMLCPRLELIHNVDLLKFIMSDVDRSETTLTETF